MGASLLSETWPRRWRPWIAAVLQTGVNVGILVAGLANIILAAAPPRYLFLVGVLPALLVFWIRRAVPEPEEWRFAKEQAHHQEPGVRDLFRGEVRSITVWVALGLRRVPDCPLGLPVLESATPAEPPRGIELDGGAEEQAGQHRDAS